MARHKKSHGIKTLADHHPGKFRHAGHDAAAKFHADTTPAPGPTDFSAEQEQAMRQSAPQPATMGGAPDGDADDMM